LSILLLISRCSSTAEITNINNNYRALLDTVRSAQVVTVYGDTVNQYSTRVLELTRKELADLAKSIQSKDSAISALLRIVNKNTVNATYYTTNTTVVASSDTIYLDTITYSYPAYTVKFSDYPWYKATTFVTQDSSNLELSIYNPFEVTHEYKKVDKGIFKPKELVVNVTPLNPYTTLSELKSYSIPQIKNYGVIGIDALYANNTVYAGVGVGVIRNRVMIKGNIATDVLTGKSFIVGVSGSILISKRK